MCKCVGVVCLGSEIMYKQQGTLTAHLLTSEVASPREIEHCGHVFAVFVIFTSHHTHTFSACLAVFVQPTAPVSTYEGHTPSKQPPEMEMSPLVSSSRKTAEAS